MFNHLPATPGDIILATSARAAADTAPEKVNLSIGVYRDEKGEPFVPATIQGALRQIPVNNLEYTAAAGLPAYLQATAKLLLDNFDREQIAMQATTGWTQALAILNQLIDKDPAKLIIGSPTRGNHNAIFGSKVHQIPHLTTDNTIYEQQYKDIMYHNPGSYIMIQGGLTHNPTGINFTNTQAANLIDAARENNMKIILDVAYFWFGQSFEEDRKWISAFWNNLPDVAMTMSYSKNASLYRLRTGALFVKTANKPAVEWHIQQICRTMTSTAPSTGQEAMANVINNADTYANREREVAFMRESIIRRRKMLVEALENPRFAYIAQWSGLFSMLGLSPTQVEQLAQKHVYILPDGRTNIAGVHKNNVQYVADSINAVL